MLIKNKKFFVFVVRISLFNQIKKKTEQNFFKVKIRFLFSLKVNKGWQTSIQMETYKIYAILQV